VNCPHDNIYWGNPEGNCSRETSEWCSRCGAFRAMGSTEWKYPLGFKKEVVVPKCNHDIKALKTTMMAVDETGKSFHCSEACGFIYTPPPKLKAKCVHSLMYTDTTMECEDFAGRGEHKCKYCDFNVFV